MINRRQATGLILGGLSLITVASSLVPPAVSGISPPVPVKTGKMLPDLFLGDPGAPAAIV